MKILIAAFTSLALCACADPSARRLIEVGESCAAIGKGIQVSNGQDSAQQQYFWSSYLRTDTEVKCR